MNEKLTFWKKFKISITDFEKYQDLAAEKISKTIIYILVLMSIFSLVISGLYMYKFVTIIQDTKQYISENIETITFENNKLNIVSYQKEKQEILIGRDGNIASKIIIDTNIQDEETKNKEIEEIKSSGNGILILNDKILVKNELVATPREYKYEELAKQLELSNLNKEKVIQLLSIESMMPMIVICAVTIFIYMLTIYLSTVLVDILIFSAMGYIFTILAKIRIKFTAVYNIAAHAVTLPIALNLIYFVVNFFTGFTIKYFDITYSAITSIYIIAAILIIKSETIKKQIELTRIIEEQEKVKEELKRKEEEQKENKEKKEQEEDKDESEEEQKEKKDRKKKDGTDINIGKEPEGNNV